MVSGRRAAAFEEGSLVETVEDRWLAIPVFCWQLDAGKACEGGHEVQRADDLGVAPSGFDRRGPPRDRRDTVAAFVVSSFRSPKRCVTAIRVDVLPGAVIGRPDDQRLLFDPELPDLVENEADIVIQLHQ
jgi:hypothetical protein